MIHSSHSSHDIYYDISTKRWDDLCIQAEDLLLDKDIGQHIVGLYPYGERTFGLESKPPGLLALYIGSIEDVISPFKKQNMYQFSVNDNSSILFIELRDWIQKLSLVGPDMTHMTACFHDIIQQEDSIDKIISITRDYINVLFPEYFKNKNYYLEFSPLLDRAMLIFKKRKEWQPCINQNWETVIDLNEITKNPYLIKLDIKIRKEYLKKGFITSGLKDDYLYLLNQERTKKELSDTKQDCKERLEKEVIEFYRFML